MAPRDGFVGSEALQLKSRILDLEALRHIIYIMEKGALEITNRPQRNAFYMKKKTSTRRARAPEDTHERTEHGASQDGRLSPRASISLYRQYGKSGKKDKRQKQKAPEAEFDRL